MSERHTIFRPLGQTRHREEIICESGVCFNRVLFTGPRGSGRKQPHSLKEACFMLRAAKER